MAVNDTYVLNDVIYRTLENGAANASGVCVFGMFTVSQIVAAMNQRQQKFLKDTGCVATGPTSIASIAGQQPYVLPQDYIDDLRLSYAEAGAQRYALQRVDAWEIDSASPDWEYTQGTPAVYNTSTLPTLTLDIAPLPLNNGSLGLLYVAMGATLTGLGVNLVVPETFIWAITWGIIADLLSSDGEALDVQRSQYAESRYQQGVELCRILIGGNANG